MHWNVAPDALPGSARLVRVLDRWLNDCFTLKFPDLWYTSGVEKEQSVIQNDLSVCLLFENIL